MGVALGLALTACHIGIATARGQQTEQLSAQIGAAIPSSYKAIVDAKLVSLPVESWPYGRVVAVSDVGIIAASGNDAALIARNRIAVLAILKKLRVAVERFPT